MVNNNFSNSNTNKKATKDKAYSVKLEPNALHQYASYNYIFTLSALSPNEMKNPDKILSNTPHNIIARTGGIGPYENNPDTDQNVGLDTDSLFTKKHTDTGDETFSTPNNVKLFQKVTADRNILSQNRDIYFSSVEIDTVHGLNGERSTGTNTSIRMQLTEPTGITLINKIRGAAANNGFLDHVDAPFLLTLQFTGFDELGRVKPIDQIATTKKIPIKIVKMDVNVNQAGATYDLTAIPYSEFAMVNRFNYLRGTNTLKKQETLEGFVKHFEKMLNDQITSETRSGYFENESTQDQYRITIDESLRDKIIQSETNILRQLEMGDGIDDDQRIGYNTLGQTTGNHTIVRILEEVMKSLSDFNPNKLYEDWLRVIKIIENTKQTTSPDDYYIDFFRIKTSLTPTTTFDMVTKNNKKIIHYHIAPFKIHAYSLNRSGVSSGTNAQTVVHKLYDYIFTGNNTDILDLDIQYKVAYYQSQLKDYRPQTDNPTTGIGWTTSRPSKTDTIYGEPDLPYKNYVGTAQSAQQGVIDPNNERIQMDQFVDALTNPVADMVNINMKILGDPSWIGQSQFLPISLGDKSNIQKIDKDSNAGTDTSSAMFQTIKGQAQSWSEKYKSFNTDQAEPVINLRLIMPTDFNEKTGMYELNKTANGVFTGLYKVWKTVSTFDNGTFTQNLYAVRFNNQGEEQTTNVTSTTYTYAKDTIIEGGETIDRETYDKNPTAYSGSF
jgi:hypothetical protein